MNIFKANMKLRRLRTKIAVAAVIAVDVTVTAVNSIIGINRNTINCYYSTSA